MDVFYRFFLHHMKDVLVTSYLLHSSIILRCSWINILFSWSATMASCWRIRLLWARRMSSSSVSRRRRVDSWLEIRLDNLETEKKIATIFTNQKQTKRKYLKHLNQWSLKLCQISGTKQHRKTTPCLEYEKNYNITTLDTHHWLAFFQSNERKHEGASHARVTCVSAPHARDLSLFAGETKRYRLFRKL